jgi:hypothetical protein
VIAAGPHGLPAVLVYGSNRIYAIRNAVVKELITSAGKYRNLSGAGWLGARLIFTLAAVAEMIVHRINKGTILELIQAM